MGEVSIFKKGVERVLPMPRDSWVLRGSLFASLIPCPVSHQAPGLPMRLRGATVRPTDKGD